MKPTVQTLSVRSLAMAVSFGSLLLLSALLLLAGCSADDEGDAQQILQDAIPAMQALSSFSFTYDVQRPSDAPPIQGTDVVALDGSVDDEGGMRARIDILQGGIPLQIDFIAVGDTHYVENPITRSWQSVPAATSPVGELNLGASAINILEKVQDPEYEGRSEVDGAAVHQVSGTVAAEDVEGIVQALRVDHSFPVDVWVGVEDDLVRRIVLTGPATPAEHEDTVRTIDLSGFDEPVEIEPPA
jgi:lipoprotein LprG